MAQHQDVITPLDIARKIPGLTRKLPRMVRGLLMANSTNNTETVGLGWAVEKSTRENPHGIAVRYRDQQLTYAEFNQWSNRIAHKFLSQGLKKSDVVIVLIENRPELLATVTGLAKIGVICAMVNTAQTGKVLIHSINLVKPVRLIAGAECVEQVEAVRDDLHLEHNQFYWVADDDSRSQPGLAPAGWKNLAIEIQGFPSYNPVTTRDIHRKDGLFYIYTSGTTGLPKAAVFNHGRWMKSYGGFGFTFNLGEHDVLYATLPFYHATAMVVCWGAVLAGNAGVAMRRKFSASEFWDDCRKYQATAIGYVGELCRYLLDRPAGPQDHEHKVRKMVGNGMRPNIWGPFKSRFGIEEVAELYAS